MDLGFQKAGFDCRVAIELDRDAVDTLADNGQCPIIHDDVHHVASSTILEIGELVEGDVDLVLGGPPCQPFSKSAYWRNGSTKRLDDPRASTLEQFLRVVRDVKPRAFMIENVPGLGYRGKDEGWQLIVGLIETINDEVGTSYSLSKDVLDASDFGVPQRRRRLFIVGSRDGRDFRFPSATHGVPTNGAAPLHARLTAWDAIGELDDADEPPGLWVGGRWGGLLPSIPEGQNYLYHTARGSGLPLFGWRTRFWSFLLKLAKDQPSPTLTATPGSATGPFHWKNRRLSVLELLRLQTFPPDYRVSGGRTSAQRQVGNAVPPALAHRLAIEIRAQLLDDKYARRRRRAFLPVRRTDLPPPETPSPVPEAYHDLIGEHAPHPGPGRGPGALARSSG